MSDTLVIGGTTYSNVEGFKATDSNNNTVTYIKPSGTKAISANGTVDVTEYASASVSVPNTYAAGDEGKVVSNGALVAQSSQSITQNGNYDTTLIDSITVNVSGGGGKSDMNGWANNVKYTDLTIIQNEYVNNYNGSFVSYNGWNRTGYVPINGASLLILPAMSGTGGDTKYNAFYTESHVFISAFNIKRGTKSAVNVPSNAYYFVLSETAAMLNEIITSGVIPIE